VGQERAAKDGDDTALTPSSRPGCGGAAARGRPVAPPGVGSHRTVDLANPGTVGSVHLSASGCWRLVQAEQLRGVRWADVGSIGPAHVWGLRRAQGSPLLADRSGHDRLLRWDAALRRWGSGAWRAFLSARGATGGAASRPLSMGPAALGAHVNVHACSLLVGASLRMGFPKIWEFNPGNPSAGTRSWDFC